ncbi:DUF87 domain-containing protein [Paenibacillus melissococcoides]|uniref:DUF87 domain-containing protein n=1 Tax=Paenibacillus melissococcoides TaxID=2912268 RepID=A0ABN8UBC6_9BACL|nr:DUF87 domain-containing protein [Paenibacillus melissococcoides]CAH8248456.1 DUF87 domain-containing protein [Paenibacillus melissococcoides]
MGAIVLGVAGLTTYSVLHQQKVNREYRISYRYLRIIPHENIRGDKDSIMKLIHIFNELRRTNGERRRQGREWFRYWIHKSEQGKLEFYLGYPEDRKTGVHRALMNTYPDIEIKELQSDEIPLCWSQDFGGVYGGQFVLQRQGEESGYALQQYGEKTDLEDILSCLEAGAADSEAFLEVLFSPESHHELRKVVKKSLKRNDRPVINNEISLTDAKAWKAAFMGQKYTPKQATKGISKIEVDADEKGRIKTLQSRYTGRESVFSVIVRVMVKAPYANSIAQTAAAVVRQAYALDNGLHLQPDKKIERQMFTFAPIPKSKGIIMTGEEVAHLFRLPQGGHRIYQFIPHLKKGQRLLQKEELSQGISIGTMEHPLEKNREVKIPPEQFTRHFVLTGKSGGGKSSMLLEILDSVLQDFIINPDKSIGVTLFDPAQETIATILNRLRFYDEEMGKKVDWSKVHYFNFSNPNFVLPLNLMYKRNEHSIYEMTEEVVDLLTNDFSVAPQMERILRNALITLLSDNTQQNTVLGIIPLLTNTKILGRILPMIKDHLIRDFWMSQFEVLSKNLGQAISPLLNRLDPFTTNVNMRRMFGYPGLGLDIRRWMDEGHICLFDLKGISEQALKLTVGFTKNEYHRIAQTRGTGSKPHLIIEDEAHRTQFPVTEKIIAEDRKFGLSQGISTQNLEQLNPNLIKAMDIIGNIFTAKLGPTAAGMMSGMVNGHFDKKFLQELPERQIAVYTSSEVDGQKYTTTTTVTARPPFVYRPGHGGKWADYKDDKQMKEAFDFGLQKGEELMARDGVPVEKVDQVIQSYIKTGIMPEWREEKAGSHSVNNTKSEKSTNAPIKLRRASASNSEDLPAPAQSRSRWE